MNISTTVGILILTVFLSLSAPAYAGTANPFPVYGYVNYTNGTPADGELVTIYKAGDPLNSITAEVGSSYGVSGFWKADLYNIPGSVTDGDTIVVDVLGKPTTFVVDTSPITGKGGQWVPDTPPTPDNGGDDNGGSSGGSSGDGTYPPGWGDPASTPAATPASTAAAPEPTVAPAEAPTVAQTEAPSAEAETKEMETETTKMETKGTPGFGAVLTVFAIAGLLVAAYLVMRRRE